jgi:hypothetical protein
MVPGRGPPPRGPPRGPPPGVQPGQPTRFGTLSITVVAVRGVQQSCVLRVQAGLPYAVLLGGGGRASRL